MKMLKKRSSRENVVALLLILPMMIPLSLFWLYPVFDTLYLSFTDWNYISADYNIVGFDNYIEVFGSQFFYKVLRNTFFFILGAVFCPIVIGLFLATKLNNITRGKGFFLTGIFASWLTPMVIVSMVWSNIFAKDNGFVNQVIILFGGEPIPWLGQGNTAMLVIIIVTVWQYLGLSTLLFTSAMSKSDPNVEEAARLDGAKGLRKFFKLTLPAISPTVFVLLIMFLLDSLKAYDQIYILTQGGPAGATSTLLYYFYIAAFQWFETGLASTLAMLILLLALVISGINVVFSKKWVRY